MKYKRREDYLNLTSMIKLLYLIYNMPNHDFQLANTNTTRVYRIRTILDMLESFRSCNQYSLISTKSSSFLDQFKNVGVYCRTQTDIRNWRRLVDKDKPHILLLDLLEMNDWAESLLELKKVTKAGENLLSFKYEK